MEDRSAQVSGTAGLFIALTWLFAFLEVYSKTFIVKSWGSEDCFAAIAQILFTVYCFFSISGAIYGTGKHVEDIVPASNEVTALKWWWCCEPCYVAANCFLKISIGIFLLRIAISRLQRVTIITVMIVQSIISLMYFFLFIYQCSPPEYFWEQYLAGSQGTCLNTMIIVNSTYGYSAMCSWADWTLCILPAFMVMPLQMNRRTKLMVILLLSLSAIASIATIIRIPYIGELTDKTDFLYSTTDVAIWSTAESGIAITASNAATLRPLFRNFLARSRLSRRSHDCPTSLALSKAPWPKSTNPIQAGYLKSSSSQSDIETDTNSTGDVKISSIDENMKREVGGSKDIGITTTVTTVYSERGNEEDDLETGELGKRAFDSLERMRNERDWNANHGRTGWRDRGVTMTTTIAATR